MSRRPPCPPTHCSVVQACHKQTWPGLERHTRSGALYRGHAARGCVGQRHHRLRQNTHQGSAFTESACVDVDAQLTSAAPTDILLTNSSASKTSGRAIGLAYFKTPSPRCRGAPTRTVPRRPLRTSVRSRAIQTIRLCSAFYLGIGALSSVGGGMAG